jgi:hypothetical protein
VQIPRPPQRLEFVAGCTVDDDGAHQAGQAVELQHERGLRCRIRCRPEGVVAQVGGQFGGMIGELRGGHGGYRSNRDGILRDRGLHPFLARQRPLVHHTTHRGGDGVEQPGQQRRDEQYAAERCGEPAQGQQP